MKLLNVAGGFFIGVGLGLCALLVWIVWDSLKYGDEQ